MEKMTVLVIEDYPPMRDTLCAMLETYEFHVRGCGDGASALEAASKGEYHAFIIDYSMPNMNGADLTKRLRRLFPPAAIIGVSLDDRKEEFIAAGADAFLQKPYRYIDLVSLITAKSI